MQQLAVGLEVQVGHEHLGHTPDQVGQHVRPQPIDPRPWGERPARGPGPRADEAVDEQGEAEGEVGPRRREGGEGTKGDFFFQQPAIHQWQQEDQRQGVFLRQRGQQEKECRQGQPRSPALSAVVDEQEQGCQQQVQGYRTVEAGDPGDGLVVDVMEAEPEAGDGRGQPAAGQRQGQVEHQHAGNSMGEDQAGIVGPGCRACQPVEQGEKQIVERRATCGPAAYRPSPFLLPLAGHPQPAEIVVAEISPQHRGIDQPGDHGQQQAQRKNRFHRERI